MEARRLFSGQQRTVDADSSLPFVNRYQRQSVKPRRKLPQYALIVVALLLFATTIFQLKRITHVATFKPIFSGRPQDMALVILTRNRPFYLKAVLDHVFQLPNDDLTAVKVYVSQDGLDQKTVELVEQYATKLTHIRRSNFETASTSSLSRHMKWTLDTLFFERQHGHVIILEDDLIVSPDFLSYFRYAAPLFLHDPRLLCVSAFNDNGVKRFANDPSRLFLTNFFPGLGWMIPRSIWKQLSPIFPDNHFDWWMRFASDLQTRHCLAPEVSRTLHIGNVGLNVGREQYTEGFVDSDFSVNQSSIGSDGFYRGEASVSFPSVESMVRSEYESRLTERINNVDATIDPNDSDQIRQLLVDHNNMPDEGSNKTVLILFKNSQEFDAVSAIIPLNHENERRGFYRGVTEFTLPFNNGQLLLADAQKCVFLEPKHRHVPGKVIAAVAGDKGQSCTDACAARQFVCDPTRFRDVALGSVIEQHFPCERDMWSVDHNPANPRYVREGTCFTSSAEHGDCDAVDYYSYRLCPCSPKI